MSNENLANFEPLRGGRKKNKSLFFLISVDGESRLVGVFLLTYVRMVKYIRIPGNEFPPFAKFLYL